MLEAAQLRPSQNPPSLVEAAWQRPGCYLVTIGSARADISARVDVR